jgi:hypothetical protein
MADLTSTIVPKSDQLNSDDLIAGPRTFTVTEVRVKSTPEQPVDIHLAESPGKPFRPSKTVLRILVTAWGKEGDEYVGRRMTLYRDAEVKWAGQEVGGIRVSALSHITKQIKLALTETRGKKVTHIVKPLADDAPTEDYQAEAAAATDLAGWRQVWQRAKDAGHLTDALKAQLMPIGEALKTEPKPEIPTEEPPNEDWPTPAAIPGTEATS